MLKIRLLAGIFGIITLFSFALTKEFVVVHHVASGDASEDAQEPDDPEPEEDQGKGGEEDREFG